MVLGSFIFGLIVETVAALQAEVNGDSAVSGARLGSLNRYMRYADVPAKLQRRIRAHFRVIWKAQGQVTREQELTSDLSDQLRQELVQHLNRDLIQKLNLFTVLRDRGFVDDLVASLQCVFFPEGEQIDGMIEGDDAKEMYFIKHGKVDFSARYAGHGRRKSVGYEIVGTSRRRVLWRDYWACRSREDPRVAHRDGNRRALLPALPFKRVVQHITYRLPAV